MAYVRFRLDLSISSPHILHHATSHRGYPIFLIQLPVRLALRILMAAIFTTDYLYRSGYFDAFPATGVITQCYCPHDQAPP